MKCAESPDFINKWGSMFAFVFLFTICAVLVIERETLAEQPISDVSIIASIILVVVFVVITIVSKRGIWSITSVFILVYCIFHFGIIVINAANLPLSKEFQAYLNKWWFNDSTHYAIVLVSIGLTSFASGSLLALSFGKRGHEIKEEKYAIERVVLLTGFCLVVISVSIWFFDIFAKGGLSLLTGSYHDYIDNDSAGFLDGYHLHFGSLGLIFLAISKPGKLRNVGLIIFAVFAIFALPLGLRGRVLFPVLAAIAVASMKKIPISTTKTLILGLCVLSAISVFRQIRQVGLAETKIDQLSLGPLKAWPKWDPP